jgi:hypothetical protein
MIIFDHSLIFIGDFDVSFEEVEVNGQSRTRKVFWIVRAKENSFRKD